MRKKKQLLSLQDFYDELLEIKNLHDIGQEALYYCFENERDYRNLFAFDKIYCQKFERLIDALDEYMNKNSKEIKFK